MNRQQITEALNKMHEIAQLSSARVQAFIAAYDACKAIDRDIEMTGAASEASVDIARAAITSVEKESA